MRFFELRIRVLPGEIEVPVDFYQTRAKAKEAYYEICAKNQWEPGEWLQTIDPNMWMNYAGETSVKMVGKLIIHGSINER